MQLKPARLPWKESEVFVTSNLRPWFRERLPGGFDQYLPATILLYADPEVSLSDVEDFLAEMTLQLRLEIERRRVRQSRFVSLGLFREDELHSVLTGSTDVQPWLLYYSSHGGVGDIDFMASPDRCTVGYKPCSSMTNHGLAWHERDARFFTWLVTSRKPGCAWDWDSDIGHESAHAAFAPVPLYTQIIQSEVPIAELSSVRSATSANASHLGRIGYPYSELAVVSVRGEPRPTSTHLPVVETIDQLHGLLELSLSLMPGMGFDRALAAVDRARGVIDVNESDEVYELSAPVLRIMPALARMAGSRVPPTVEWYRSIALGSAIEAAS